MSWIFRNTQVLFMEFRETLDAVMVWSEHGGRCLCPTGMVVREDNCFSKKNDGFVKDPLPKQVMSSRRKGGIKTFI